MASVIPFLIPRSAGLVVTFGAKDTETTLRAALATGADKAIRVELLRETIRTDRIRLSPRVRSLRAILAKLDPQPVVETMPPPKPPGEPGMAQRKGRRR